MDVRDAVNRGNNLFALALLGVGGGTFALTVFSENELIDRADDVVIGLLALGMIVWYFWGANRYRRSAVPLVLLVLGLLTKLVAMGVELHDVAAVGDDIPGVVLFAVAVIVFTILYVRSGREDRSS